MLYIRHGQKSYCNGKSLNYSLDPDLTEFGRLNAKNRFEYLLNKFGIPDVIITSPYLRTRETAQIAQNVILEQTGQFIPIMYDPLIGEYLGNQKNVPFVNGLRPETLQYNPVPHETWDQFSQRVEDHVVSDKLSGWYVTHGLFIQKISSKYGFNIPYPKELTGIYIDNNHIEVI